MTIDKNCPSFREGVFHTCLTALQPLGFLIAENFSSLEKGEAAAALTYNRL